MIKRSVAVIVQSLQLVSPHCLVVWHVTCFGSLSLLSQPHFQKQQAAVFRFKKKAPNVHPPESDGGKVPKLVNIVGHLTATALVHFCFFQVEF